MWTFLNTAFLWAGLAALLPLVLHLLQRRRVVRVPFSTLRFLRLAEKKSTSRVRLENVLLWLLRTLLVLCLVLAFAGPVLRAAGFGAWAGSARRDVAIVLDGSASMRYESGFLKVWPSAVQAAADLIQGLTPGDRVSLFLAGETPIPLIEQPSGDFELALSLLRAQEPGPGPARLWPALRAAADSLRESGRRERELHVLTDGQALSWSDSGDTAANGAWTPPEGAALFVLLAGSESPENAYPLSLDVDPSLVRAGQPARLKAVIGFSGPARPTSAALRVDDREAARRSVDPGEGARQEVLFTLPPLDPGRHAVRIELPPDSLAIDDGFDAVVEAREQLPILVAGRPRDLFFLSRALNPGASFSALDARTVDPSALDGEHLAAYAGVFLCNPGPLSGQAVSALEQYLRNGGTVMVFPGDRGTPADYGSWSVLPARPLEVKDVPPRQAARLLRLLKPEDPLFAGLRLPPGATPALAVQRRLAFGPLEDKAETVVEMGYGEPFLLSRPVGRGRLLFAALSADRAWSTLPLSPFFVPLVHRIALAGAGLTAGRLHAEPAPLLDVTDFMAARKGDLNLLAPGGALLPVRRVRQEDRDLCVLEQVRQPGLYRFDADRAPALAVNLPRAESDLAPIRDADLARLPGLAGARFARAREQLLEQVREHRVGTPLAEPFLWLALVVSILETLLAARAVRRSARLSDRLEVEPSGRVRGAETAKAAS